MFTPGQSGQARMDNEYGLLGEDEVLYVRSGRILMSNPTFKVIEFLDALAQLVSEQEREWSDEREGWFNDQGQSCEVLRFDGQGWQRGRVRLRLEFCPERPPKLLRESRSAQESGYESYEIGAESEALKEAFGREDYRREDYSREDYGEDYRRDIPSPRRSRDYTSPLDEILPRSSSPDFPEPDDDY
jgi:KGK domain